MRLAAIQLLLFSVLTPYALADATGTWQGTFSVTEPCNESTISYSSPATVPLVQSGNSVTGVVGLSAVPVFDEDCAQVDQIQLAFPLAGTLNGTQFTGTLASPSFLDESGSSAASGTITDTMLSLAFEGDASTVTLTATKTSSNTPSTAQSGTYSGTYSSAFKIGAEVCPNLPELMFGGTLNGPVTQAGNVFSGVLSATGGKGLGLDDEGNCIAVDDPTFSNFEVVIGGFINGNSISGSAFGFLIFAPFTGSLSGNTFAGSGENDISRVGFSITKTSGTPAPTITRFDAQPATIQPGQSTTLTWATTNADSVLIDNGVGTKPANGSVNVSPAVTTTYTLKATGPGGSTTSSTTVGVAASPARVALTSLPSGMVQAAGVATATDTFTVTNVGGTPTALALTQDKTFYTQTPPLFMLGPGDSQVVVIRATAQPAGFFDTGTTTITGPGAAAGLTVPVKLAVAAPPAAPIVPARDRLRPELAAPANQNPMGTITISNNGSGTLQGIPGSDAAWLVPQSVFVNIPPGGSQNISFTSNRALRPDADNLLGATNARVFVNYLDFPSGNNSGFNTSQSSPSTSKTNTISVSIVDVVKPDVSPSAPPPLPEGQRALYLPALPQRTNSLGDVLLAAAGTSSISDLRLFVTGIGVNPQTTTLNQFVPGLSVAFPSLLKNVFNTTNAIGTVQIRTTATDRVTAAAIQTNTASRVGSYITALPTVRSDRSIAQGGRTFLAGVEKTGTRATTLYVQEVAGLNGIVQIDFLSAAGTVVASRATDNVTGFSLLELTDVVPPNATAVRVRNISSFPAKIVAFALVTDAATQDAFLVTDSSLDGGSTDVIVPIVPGPSTASTQATLFITNPGTSPITVSVDTIRSGGPRRRATRKSTNSNSNIVHLEENGVTNLTIPALQTMTAQTALSTGFVRVSAPSEISVSARAALTAQGIFGVFGSALPPIAPSSALSAGQSRTFAGVDDSAQRTIESRTPVTYRSNLALIESAGQSTAVRLTLRYTFSAGTRTTAQGVSTKEVTVPANQLLLVGDLSKTIIGAARATYGDLRNMQLDVDITSGGRVIPILQTIDNGSGDMSVRSE